MNYNAIAYIAALAIVVIVSLSCNVDNFRYTSWGELDKNVHKINKIRIGIVTYSPEGIGIHSTLKVLENEEKVGPIVSQFAQHKNGWEKGKFMPYLLGNVNISFYKDDKIITHVMLVSSVDETSHKMKSYYLSQYYGPVKAVNQNEFQELLNLLELDAELTERNF